jgi:hypothetical protein
MMDDKHRFFVTTLKRGARYQERKPPNCREMGNLVHPGIRHFQTLLVEYECRTFGGRPWIICVPPLDDTKHAVQQVTLVLEICRKRIGVTQSLGKRRAPPAEDTECRKSNMSV